MTDVIEQRWRVCGYTANQEIDVIELTTNFRPALDANDPTFHDEIHRLASMARAVGHLEAAGRVEFTHLLTVDLWRDGQ